MYVLPQMYLNHLNHSLNDDDLTLNLCDVHDGDECESYDDDGDHGSVLGAQEWWVLIAVVQLLTLGYHNHRHQKKPLALQRYYHRNHRKIIHILSRWAISSLFFSLNSSSMYPIYLKINWILQI